MKKILYVLYAGMLNLLFLPIVNAIIPCDISRVQTESIMDSNPLLAVKTLSQCMNADEAPKWVDQDFSIAYFKSMQRTNRTIQYYDTFRALLNISIYEDIQDRFKFIDALERENADVNLFQGEKNELETYYFYYDTGRIFSYKRGIALTESTLIWKNMFHSVKKIEFDNIKSISLHYEKGWSLTGWNLIINNDDEDLTIRLSEISDEQLLYFLNDILFYINSDRSINKAISLNIPDSEQKILAGSIWERHSGVIIGTAVVATAVAVSFIAPDQVEAAKVGAAAVVISMGAKVASSMPTMVRGNAGKVSAFISKVKDRSVSIGRGVKVNIKALPKSFKSFDVVNKAGKIIGSYKIKDLYRSQDIVKMKYVGISAANSTFRGFQRNSKIFWKSFMRNKEAEKAISRNNKKLLAAGKSPVVDKTWIKFHPNHKKFLGETLEHHHVNHGSKAIPLPSTLHRSSNYDIWHEQGGAG